MKKYAFLSLVSLFALGSISCQNMTPNAQRGAVGGAVLGGVVGHQSGNALQGAAIGAALGGLGGQAYDNNQRNRNY